MILYHFCSERAIAGIQKRGLRYGKFPLVSRFPPSFIDNIQWLTSESDPTKQSWATTQLINYSRTDYRLTVEVPTNRYWKLKTALQYVEGMHPDNQSIVKNWAGHDKWYIYEGKIPTGWIVEVENTTSPQLISAIAAQEAPSPATRQNQTNEIGGIHP